MILIGLGSNLPLCGSPPREIVGLAIRAIGRLAEVSAVSRFYASPAWPNPEDPPFVNAVIALASAPPPAELLGAIHEIEAAFGRRRGERNAPRTLDLDLLAYDRLVAQPGAGSRLVLPHPGLPERDFVLAPLCDIAPDWICPASGRSARKMLAALKTVAAAPIAGSEERISAPQQL